MTDEYRDALVAALLGHDRPLPTPREIAEAKARVTVGKLIADARLAGLYHQILRDSEPFGGMQ